MAVKKKYPKSPKSSASLEIWERYKSRMKEVDDHNKKIIADKAKKVKLISEIKKLKSK